MKRKTEKHGRVTSLSTISNAGVGSDGAERWEWTLRISEFGRCYFEGAGYSSTEQEAEATVDGIISHAIERMQSPPVVNVEYAKAVADFLADADADKL